MARHRAITAVCCAGTAALLGACNGDGRTLDPPTAPLPATTVPATVVPTMPSEPTPAAFTVLAPWPDGAEIPSRYTCDGEGLSPPLTWSGVPAGVVELVITVTDLDAGQPVLWIVDAVDASRSGLVEDEVPEEAFERANTAGELGYEAPCPPPGSAHRYLFTVHALNQQLEVADDASAAEVIEVLNSITVDQAAVSGTVARPE